MKRFLTIASLTFALSVGAGAAYAGKNDANKPAKGDRAAKRDADAVTGLVQKVDGDKLTVLAGRGKKAAEVTVTTDASTKVKVNGQDGKLDQIKPGMRVVAKPNTGTAKTVVARDAGERKNKKSDAK